MTVGHAMSFAKLCERLRESVCVRVCACPRARGSREWTKNTKSGERTRRNGEQGETRVEFISCSREKA